MPKDKTLFDIDWLGIIDRKNKVSKIRENSKIHLLRIRLSANIPINISLFLFPIKMVVCNRNNKIITKQLLNPMPQ